MDDTGTGTRLPRSTSVNVSRRALMRSAAATLAVTAVAGIARPAFAQRGPVRTLLKGGVVLSFDPAVGDFEKADVLIEDKRIVAVRPDISADATAIWLHAPNVSCDHTRASTGRSTNPEIRSSASAPP